MIPVSDMDLFDWAHERDRSSPSTAMSPTVPCKLPAEVLPDDFRTVASVLRRRVGADMAITAEDIASAAGLFAGLSRESRRCKVRSVIRRHMLDFDFPVCGDSNGYYIAETPDELAHYHASMHSRIREIAIRMRSVIRQGKAAGFTYHGKGRWTSPSS
jgi:hypothetical protein